MTQAYDEKGNRKTLRYPQAGMETSYTYNEGDRVISLENKRQGAVISAWEYGYDRDGNMVSKTDKTGSSPVTISYRYDRLGRLTEEDHPGWKRTYYTYDAYSNRTKMMVEGKTKDEPVSVTSYEYGMNNLLEKEIRKQGKVTETWQYRYDDNGNETFRIWEKTAPTPEYPGTVKLSGSWKRETPAVYEWRHYNGFHQLIRINQDDREITYQYRGDGLRHSSEVRNLNESQSKKNVCYWDGMDIVAEQADDESVKSYLRGINLIAREMDGVVYYYILNEHGDVAQLRGENGTCKASYEYDAFGNEKNLNKEDENPFRYCGEYYDLSCNTYYLRARNYRAGTGRFTQQDPYWNPRNMVYGSNPIKWNGHISSPSGRNTNTYKPNVAVMMQSGNKYVYGINNPIRYQDPSGYTALSVAVPVPVPVAAPAAVAAAPYILGGVLVGGGVYGIYWLVTNDPIDLENPQSSYVGEIPRAMPSNAARADEAPAVDVMEFRLPSWKKVAVDMEHIISGHTSGGGRGDKNKDKWPDGMTESVILKAIQEAYKNAEKAGPMQYSWQDGVEHARQFYEGVWNNRTVQFWFDYTTSQIDSAWPK